MSNELENEIPVIVRMRVHCTKCGHSEDRTYEFDMPFEEAGLREESVAGECPKCAQKSPLASSDRDLPWVGIEPQRALASEIRKAAHPEHYRANAARRRLNYPRGGMSANILKVVCILSRGASNSPQYKLPVFCRPSYPDRCRPMAARAATITDSRVMRASPNLALIVPSCTARRSSSKCNQNVLTACPVSLLLTSVRHACSTREAASSGSVQILRRATSCILNSSSVMKNHPSHDASLGQLEPQLW